MGDFMVSLLQVVWFIGIYTVTTVVLVGQLDWRLAAAVLLWVAAFAALARYYVPRMRKYSAGAAEQASVLTGRIVDSFSNIQTLKLFGTAGWRGGWLAAPRRWACCRAWRLPASRRSPCTCGPKAW